MDGDSQLTGANLISAISEIGQYEDLAISTDDTIATARVRGTVSTAVYIKLY